MLHYQSRPGLYVTGDLYRPATIKGGERLPAVLYVGGHSGRGRPDAPDVLGLLAPRPLDLVGADAAAFARTTSAYVATGAKERLSFN